MLERLSDQIQDLQVQMRSLRADNNGNGNVNNNGNGNGNNRGNNSPSDEPIGIAVPAGNKPEPEPEPEPTYYCLDCENGIGYGQSRCGYCQASLNWSGIDR